MPLTTKNEQREGSGGGNPGLYFGQDLQTEPGTTSPRLDLRPFSVGPRCVYVCWGDLDPWRLDKKGQNLNYLGVINLNCGRNQDH